MNLGKSKIVSILLFILFIFIVIIIILLYQKNISQGRQKAAIEFRNLDRTSHVNILASSIDMYRQDNGSFPTEITSVSKGICKTDLPNANCTNLVNLSKLLNNYLITYPVDPGYRFGEYIMYNVKLNEDGKLVVLAPFAEGLPIYAVR